MSDITKFKKKKGETIDVTEHKMLMTDLNIQESKPNFPNLEFQKKYDKFKSTIKIISQRKNDFDYSIPNSLFLPIS